MFGVDTENLTDMCEVQCLRYGLLFLLHAHVPDKSCFQVVASLARLHLSDAQLECHSLEHVQLQYGVGHPCNEQEKSQMHEAFQICVA